MSRRLGLAFLAVLAGSLLLVSIPAGIIGNQSLASAYQAQLDATALEKQSFLLDWFDRAGRSLQAIASDSEIRTASGEPAAVQQGSILEHLAAWSGSNSEFLALAVADPGSGRILASSESDRAGRLIRPELTAAWPSDGVNFSPVFFDGSPAQPVMYAVTPLPAVGQPQRLYLVGQLNLAQVNAIINRRTGSNRSDEALLLNHQMQMVVVPRLANSQVPPGQIHVAAAQELCVQGKNGSIQANDYRGVPAAINYRWLAGPQLCLIVKLDQAEIFAPSRTLDLALLGVGLVGLLLAMLVATLISAQIVRPLNELVHGVEAFGQGQLDLRLPVDTREEIGRLRAAFNRMADNLQHSLGQLSESQERYRRLAEGTFEGLVFSENETILDANSQLAWMFGYRQDELIGGSVLDLVAPESRDLVRNTIRQNLEKSYEFIGLRKDGSTVFMEAHGRLTPYQGRTVRMASIRDLTAQKEAEAGQARLLSILEATPDYISTASADGNFLYLNRAARHMLGIAPGADVSRINLSDVHPAWANRILMEVGIPTALRDGVWVGENAILGRGGGEIPVSKVLIAHRTDDGQLEYLSTINRDISARIQLEKELRAARDLLEQRVEERTRELDQKATELARSNSELEQFAYIASHDLQEPLRMISSYLQLIERRYKGRLDQDADEYIHFAVDGAQRLKALINDLLSYSRAGNRGRPFEPVDTADLVEQLRQALQVTIRENGAEITTAALPVVMGDAAQLSQLFQNLVTNALKFRGEQPPRIHISAEPIPQGWQFAVRDNGIGIDPQYAERIFVIFQRLHGRDQYPGTGIGLAVCKRIVERHAGRIWVESQPGQGATFFFTLVTT
jgi:PAS domain S-box-containing protein